MNRYEAKEAYVNKRMEENAKIESLTEEQHDALAELCSIRHKIHCSDDSMFNPYCSNYHLWNYITKSYDNGDIYYMLKDADLPTIDFGFAEGTPDASWYDDLTDDERQEWEDRADEVNKELSFGLGLHHTGYSLWIEDSWEYEEFTSTINRINTVIENYLREIDAEYGTSYCPTGISRLF